MRHLLRLIIIRNVNNKHSKLINNLKGNNNEKITIIAFFMALFANYDFAAEVNVFSARHYDSDIQLYEKFTAKTGIKVNVVSGKDKALQKRITEEGQIQKLIFILLLMLED